MAKCIECGEKTKEGKFNHPEWPLDNVCETCHPSLWDDWIEQMISDYLDEVGTKGAFVENLEAFRRQ